MTLTVSSPAVEKEISHAVRKYGWRLSRLRIMDADDLKQEMRICFCAVQKHASPSSGDAALIWLFRNKIQWRICDMLRKYIVKGKIDQHVSLSDDDVLLAVEAETALPDRLHEGMDMESVIGTAPEQIQSYIRAKLNGDMPQGVPLHDAITQITGLRIGTFYRYLRKWGEMLGIRISSLSD